MPSLTHENKIFLFQFDVWPWTKKLLAIPSPVSTHLTTDIVLYNNTCHAYQKSYHFLLDHAYLSMYLCHTSLSGPLLASQFVLNRISSFIIPLVEAGQALHFCYDCMIHSNFPSFHHNVQWARGRNNCPRTFSAHAQMCVPLLHVQNDIRYHFTLQILIPKHLHFLGICCTKIILTSKSITVLSTCRLLKWA